MWDDLIGENLAVADPVNQTRSLIDRIGIGAIPWNTQGPDLSGVIGSNADYQNKIANSTVPAAMGSFVPSPSDRVLNQVKSVNWNDQSWRGQYAGDYGGSDFSPYNGGSDFEMPAPMQQYAPANALPLPDQSQYQSLGIGLTPEQSRDAMNATGFGTAKANAAAEAERGGAWGGIQGNPYFMGIRPQATNVLGYQGSFMGGSRGYTDDSAGQAWDQAANRNVEIQRMLGNQAVARQSNANDMMRTMMAVDQRRENSRMMGQSRFDQLLGKTAKGKRGELADTGEREGFLSPDAAGSMRIEDAMYNSLAGNANKGVVNIPGFLAGLQKNFDPKRMDINGLVEQLKAAGIDPNSIRQYADDPNVGAFAKSLLGPDVPVLKPLSRMVRSLQDTIYGGGTAAPPSDMDKFKASLPDWSKYTPQQPQQPQSTMQWLQSLLY